MGFSLFGEPEKTSSGFRELPRKIQNVYKGYAQGLHKNILQPLKQGNADMFRPMGFTQDELNARDTFRQGFTPTEQSLRKDVSMFMNPYDDYVVSDIMRSFGSKYSDLSELMSGAGQMTDPKYASNRAILGDNDIALSRANMIGQFKQGQYNNAISNVLNNLIPQRVQDASMMMGLGESERALDMQQKLAPMTGYSMVGQAMGALPTDGGSQATGAQASSIDDIGKMASAAGQVIGMFSDERLKENIEPVGVENGYKTYEFNYKGQPDKRYRGVMAQDVLKKNPDAVIEVDGYLAVKYGEIGVGFKRVN